MTSKSVSSATPARVSTVKSIGKGMRLSESATAEIVASAPEGFDPKARGAIVGLIHDWACGVDQPREKVATGGKGNQTPTDYGRGVDALRKTVGRAFAKKSDDAPVMRVNMPGLGSAIVPADHPAYASLLELLGAPVVESDADADATVSPIAA